MSFFITETTTDAPKILIISSSGLMSDRLAKQVIKIGYSAAQKTVVEFVQQPPSQQELNETYKLVWLIDLTEQFGSDEKKMLRLFPTLQINKTVVVLMDTGIDATKPELRYWSEMSIYQQEHWEKILEQTMRSSIVLALDVIGAERRNLVVGGMMDGIVNDLIVDPQIQVFLQKTDAFLEKLGSVLSQPQGRRTLLQGANVSTTELATWFKRYYQQTYNQTLLVEAVRSNAIITAPGFVAQQTDEKIAEKAVAMFLPPPVRKKTTTRVPLIEDTLEFEEPAQTAVPLRIVPHSIPYVENRMKKYEAKKHARVVQKHQDTQLSKLSKPIASTTVTEISHAPTPDHQHKKIDEELQTLFGAKRGKQKQERVQKNVHKTIVLEKKTHRREVFAVAITLVVAAILLIGLSYAGFAVSKRRVVSDVLKLAVSPEASAQVVQKDTQLLSAQTRFYHLLPIGLNLSEADRLVSLGDDMAQVLNLSNETNLLMQQGMQRFLGKELDGSNSDTFQIVFEAMSKAESLYKKLSSIDASLKNNDLNSLSEQQTAVLQNFLSKSQEQRRSLLIGEQLQQILPNLLAQEQRKTYLVLFQDNEELRPTGGYVRSYALITIERGVLIDAQVFDASQIDEQFSGVRLPPAEVQTYLGQNRWYFRDANWSPNFTQSAQDLSWFVEKTTGRKPDGVLALNGYVVQSLLHTLGPLDLPEYNEVVNEKNIFERMSLHSELQLVKTGKTEYTTAILKKLLSAIQALPTDKTEPLFSTLYQSFRQGQLFISTTDAGTNSVLSALGWGGDVVSPQCPAQFTDVSCTVDSLMQVEANVGVNRANYYVTRQIAHSVTLTPTEVQHQREVLFTNTAGSTSWPMGSYKSYIRFYVPNSAQLQSVSLDGQNLPTQLVRVGQENDRKYFGVLVDVPIQKTLRLQLNYVEPAKLNGAFSYAFFDQKQSGTGADQEKITFNFDPNMKPTLIAPEATLQSGQAIFMLQRDKHVFVGAKFQ